MAAPQSNQDAKRVLPALAWGSPAGGSGINAVHVSAAREMTRLHALGRLPPASGVQRRPAAVSHSLSSTVPPQWQLKTAQVRVPALTHEEECKNPQCHHCGQVIIPSPKSSFPIQDKPSITVNDWSIFVTKKPILNAVELDALAADKFDFPVPEMIFGNNLVRLVSERDGSAIEFDTISALETLDPGCDFKVSYHREWLQSRRSEVAEEVPRATKATPPASSGHDLTRLTSLESLKPYDWTYSVNYRGSTNIDFLLSPDTEIPVERLRRPDPILFFDEVVLFEDELGDNGILMLTVKIRVMPTCLFLLSRFFLRIDNVAFRIRDTRVFIDLDTNEVVREYKEQESSYDKVLKRVGGGMADPKGLLRDTNWVSQNIATVKVERHVHRPTQGQAIRPPARR